MRPDGLQDETDRIQALLDTLRAETDRNEAQYQAQMDMLRAKHQAQMDMLRAKHQAQMDMLQAQAQYANYLDCARHGTHEGASVIESNLSSFMLELGAVLTSEQRLTLLKAIINNSYISDESSLTLFKALNFDENTEFDKLGQVMSFSLLYSSIALNKKKLAMELISKGANPFLSFKIIGSLKEMMSYGVNWDPKILDKCYSPFAILMHLGAPKPILTSLINKYLTNVDDILDIAFMPIREMINNHLLQPNHVAILKEKLLHAIDSLDKIDEGSKVRMKNFLVDGESLEVKNYLLLNRISVIAELISYINKPYTQDQMDYNLCGACVFGTILAIKSPNAFVHIVLSLLEKGKVCYPLHLNVNDDIRKNTQHVSLLIYHSLKNADSIVNDSYNPSAKFTFFTDLTPPEQLTGWMKQISCSEIRDYTKIQKSLAKIWHPLASKLYPRGIHNQDTLYDLDFTEQFKLMQQQIKNGEHFNILLISTRILLENYSKVVEINLTGRDLARSGQINEGLFKLIGIPLDHYVVLDKLNINQIDSSLIDISILTYGTNFNLTIPLEELKNNWRGMVIAKMPTHLLNMPMDEIMHQESLMSYKPVTNHRM